MKHRHLRDRGPHGRLDLTVRGPQGRHRTNRNRGPQGRQDFWRKFKNSKRIFSRAVPKAASAPGLKTLRDRGPQGRLDLFCSRSPRPPLSSSRSPRPPLSLSDSQTMSVVLTSCTARRPLADAPYTSRNGASTTGRCPFPPNCRDVKPRAGHARWLCPLLLTHASSACAATRRPDTEGLPRSGRCVPARRGRRRRPMADAPFRC